MKHIVSVLIILFCGSTGSKEKRLIVSSQEIQLKLFTSILEDGGVYCENYSFDEKMVCFKEVYDNLKISQTGILKLEFTNLNRNLHTFYSLQLFKVDSYLGANYRYLLYYKDVESEAWFRIKGYKENDFIHFYQIM